MQLAMLLYPLTNGSNCTCIGALMCIQYCDTVQSVTRAAL